jgi:hypothetical protein
VKGGPLFARFSDHGIGVVFLAHLAGVVSAVLFWALARRQNSSGPGTAPISVAVKDRPMG